MKIKNQGYQDGWKNALASQPASQPTKNQPFSKHTINQVDREIEMTVVESEVCPYPSCGVDSHALPLTVRIDASTTCSAASKLPSILMVNNPFHLPLLKWMTLDEWTSSETILADWSLSKRRQPFSVQFVIAKKRCRKNERCSRDFWHKPHSPLDELLS